jgi:hypothetical protein
VNLAVKFGELISKLISSFMVTAKSSIWSKKTTYCGHYGESRNCGAGAHFDVGLTKVKRIFTMPKFSKICKLGAKKWSKNILWSSKKMFKKEVLAMMIL